MLDKIKNSYYHIHNNKLGDKMDIAALMTIDDLSLYLKVSRRTIYEWLKHHKIPAVKLVGQWRFQKEKIDSWMVENTKSIN
jgi:excisionase family DNA binding protein